MVIGEDTDEDNLSGIAVYNNDGYDSDKDPLWTMHGNELLQSKEMIITIIIVCVCVNITWVYKYTCVVCII